MNRDSEAIKRARKTSLLTQAEMGQKLGGITAQAVYAKEKAPERMTLEELSEWYGACNIVGQGWVKEYVDSFFIA